MNSPWLVKLMVADPQLTLELHARLEALPPYEGRPWRVVLEHPGPVDVLVQIDPRGRFVESGPDRHVLDSPVGNPTLAADAFADMAQQPNAPHVSLPEQTDPAIVVTICQLVVREKALRCQIAHLKSRLRQAEVESRQDFVTGALNRRGWRAAWRATLANRDASPTTAWAVVLVDLDQFKQINDSAGLKAGDRVLRSVARSLADQATAGQICARWGGDEFALAIPALDVDSVERQLHRIRERLSQIETGIPDLKVTASIGWTGPTLLPTLEGPVGPTGQAPAAVEEPGALDREVEELLSRAEEALRRGKVQGRDRVVRAELRSDIQAGDG